MLSKTYSAQKSAEARLLAKLETHGQIFMHRFRGVEEPARKRRKLGCVDDMAPTRTDQAGEEWRGIDFHGTLETQHDMSPGDFCGTSVSYSSVDLLKGFMSVLQLCNPIASAMIAPCLLL